MKINLLHLTILTTAFNSLQVYAMENQQLMIQAQQQQAIQSKHQFLPNNNNKTIITTTSTNASNLNPLTKSDGNITLIEEQYIAVPLEPLDNINTATQCTQNSNEITVISVWGERASPKDILKRKDNISLHCCNKSIVCTKGAALGSICGITTMTGFVIAIILMMKGII